MDGRGNMASRPCGEVGGGVTLFSSRRYEGERERGRDRQAGVSVGAVAAGVLVSSVEYAKQRLVYKDVRAQQGSRRRPTITTN